MPVVIRSEASLLRRVISIVPSVSRFSSPPTYLRQRYDKNEVTSHYSLDRNFRPLRILPLPVKQIVKVSHSLVNAPIDRAVKPGAEANKPQTMTFLSSPHAVEWSAIIYLAAMKRVYRVIYS